MNYRGIELVYGCALDRLEPKLRAVFRPLEADNSTRESIDDCIARPHGAMAAVAQAVARKVMSDFDANALIGTHDMRVLSTDQLRTLLDTEHIGGRLLDVGAGDGEVTREFAPLVDEVVTTETSSPMAKRLRERGWECHETDLFEDLDLGTFDLITLLNVIDRTARPITLLEILRAKLSERGKLVLAVPFPLKPHVHVGPLTVDPEELLPITEDGWEAQANELEKLLFTPCGYRVERLTRVPYLCRGTKRVPVTALDDAVFVLSST